MVKSTPGSLSQALDALEADHAFLLRGEVFTADVIETWLEYKRKKEVDAIAPRAPSSRIPSLLRHLNSSFDSGLGPVAVGGGRCWLLE